jgi:predicted nucleotidyltransferase
VNLPEIFVRLDELFSRGNIRYAVIGGYAVAVWGEIRATQDIDILCSTADIKRFTNELALAGCKFEHRTGDVDDPISEVVRIDFGDPAQPCEVDVLAGIRDAPAGILERRLTIVMEGHSVPVVCAEDLIVLKLLAGSARDLEDARSVVHLHRDRLNIPLLRRLCPVQLHQELDAILKPQDNVAG